MTPYTLLISPLLIAVAVQKVVVEVVGVVGKGVKGRQTPPPLLI